MLSAVRSSPLYPWQHVGAQIHRGHGRSARGIGAGLCGKLCNHKLTCFMYPRTRYVSYWSMYFSDDGTAAALIVDSYLGTAVWMFMHIMCDHALLVLPSPAQHRAFYFLTWMHFFNENTTGPIQTSTANPRGEASFELAWRQRFILSVVMFPSTFCMLVLPVDHISCSCT